MIKWFFSTGQFLLRISYILGNCVRGLLKFSDRFFISVRASGPYISSSLIYELEIPIWVIPNLDFLLSLIQTKLMIISMPYFSLFIK